ncbi:MAG: hypothetical protein WA771_16125, partial [Chthoniobacterales bacterium]
STNASIRVSVKRGQSSFGDDGLEEHVHLRGDWEKYTFTFTTSGAAQGWTLNFHLPKGGGSVCLADASVRAGADAGLPEGESFEAGNISITTPRSNLKMRQDFQAFLSDTEQDYVREMVTYLRDDLGVRVPISDSQVSWGGLLGWIREGVNSDYMNGHGYWGHPKFKGQAFGDRNWTIDNKPMTANRPGTLAHLSWQRVFGKPYVVTEYGHPFPTDYAAEIFPMIASYGARQDWGGFYQFNYSNGRRTREDYSRGMITKFFEGCMHPVKRAFIPTAAVLFRQGMMPVADEKIVGVMPYEGLAEKTILEGKYLQIPEAHKDAMLDFQVGIRLEDREGEFEWSEVPKLSETEREAAPIVWTVDSSAKPKTGQYLINVPAVRMAMGNIGGEKIELGDCSIEVTNGPEHWAAVSITSLDGNEIAKSKRTLITVTGNAENTGMIWSKNRTTVEDNFGEPPVLVEAIQATLTLPGPGRVHALDTTGAIQAEVPVREEAGKLVVDLGTNEETLWYSFQRD